MAADEGGMRRLWFFVLLAPFLCWSVFVAMLLPKLLTGPRFDGASEFFLIALLVCYVPGVLTFLVIAGIDYLLSRYHWTIGVLVCAMVGFGAAYILFYFGAQAAGAQSDFQQYGVFLGLMGGIPAGVCSWLSREKQNGSPGGAG